MAIKWGTWSYANGNGMRVGIDVSASAVTSTSTSVTFTWKTYTENQYWYADPQTLTYSGDITGTTSYTNNESSGVYLRDTRTTTYTYPTGSYGTSPDTETVTAVVGATYNGSAPRVTVSIAVPARPNTGPLVPYNNGVIRNSDTSITVNVGRNAEPSRPVTSLTIQKQTNGGTWTTVKTFTGSWTTDATMTWIDTLTKTNQWIVYRFRQSNSSGSSAWVLSNYVATTPAPPTSVSAMRVDDSISVSWVTNNPSNVNSYVQRSVNGGAWTDMTSALAPGVLSWIDTSPGVGTNQYRVNVGVGFNNPTTNYSLYSTQTLSNTVSTITPPAAPTQLAPSGLYRDGNLPIVLTWKHNDGGDGAAQTAYQIRWSSDGGATWTAMPTVASTASTATLPAGTWANGMTIFWQVATKAIDPAYGPWSTSATVSTSSTPTVTPVSIVNSTPVGELPVVVQWDFAQGEARPQTAWRVTLVRNGQTVLIHNGTGSQQSYEFSYPFADGQTYTAYVTATAIGGLWAPSGSTTFTISFLPPAPVDLTVTLDPESGANVLTLIPRFPVAGTNVQQTVAEVQRLASTGDWITLLDDVDLTMVEPIAQRTNLITNPSFEPNLTGWTSGRLTLSRDTSKSTSGSASIKGVCNDASNDSYFAESASGLTSHPVTPGQRVTGAYDLYDQTAGVGWSGYYFYDATGTLLDVGGVQSVAHTARPANQWTRIVSSVAAPAGSAYVRFLPGGKPRAVGASAWVDSVILEVGEVGSEATSGSYFDGATVYADGLLRGLWLGAPNASASQLVSPGSITVIDPTPILKGTNTYRLVVSSATPTIVAEEPVEQELAGWADVEWAFLSWGVGFTSVARLQGDLVVSETLEREREAREVVGLEKPVLLVGSHRSRKLSISGSLAWDKGCQRPENESSTVDDFRVASQDAEVVLWRDWTGRRVFGHLGEVSVGETSLFTGAVSFAVTETWREEGL